MRLIPALLVLGVGAPALMLAGCSLAPEYARPALPVPEALTGAASPDAQLDFYGLYQTGWRDFFSDPRLQALIETGLRNNPDLRLAVIAIGEARARYRVARSERFPMLDVQGSDVYSGPFKREKAGMGMGAAASPGATNSFEAMAMAGFELDLFGKLRNMSEAAFQSYLASAEAEKMVRTALVAEVARFYLAERLAAELLELAQTTHKSRLESLSFIERRVESGQSSALDLEMARAMVEEAAAMAAMNRRDVIMAINALRRLLGNFAELTLPDAVPLAGQRLPELPDGVSSQVLLALPEVMEAEHMLLMANADIGAARAAFFPSISLTGNLGYMSDDLKRLFIPTAGLWAFLPRVSVPIFNGGRNRAQLELAELRKESSIANYEKSVQTAFSMAAEALQSKAAFVEQEAAQKNYLAARRQVLELATNSYAGGAVSYLEVLDAQREVFLAEQDYLRVCRDQLVNSINLYLALGGGLGARPDQPQLAAE